MTSEIPSSFMSPALLTLYPTCSYVVEPLIENPLLRDEVAQQVVNELYAHVDVTRLLQESLPKKAHHQLPSLSAK